MTKANGVHSTQGETAPEIPDLSPQQLFHAIGKLRRDARDEVNRLLQFLDETENHMELEPEDEDDDAEREPSLGSLDRAVNQSRWGAGTCDDTEHEFDGREPDDTGIGDQDGLDEQEPFRDWQHGGMV